MDQEIKELLEKNLAKTEELAAQIKKIRKYIFMDQVANIAKLALIVLPLIFAAIYLPPLFRDYLPNLLESYGLVK